LCFLFLFCNRRLHYLLENKECKEMDKECATIKRCTC
jgi:hypothetical protein